MDLFKDWQEASLEKALVRVSRHLRHTRYGMTWVNEHTRNAQGGHPASQAHLFGHQAPEAPEAPAPKRTALEPHLAAAHERHMQRAQQAQEARERARSAPRVTSDRWSADAAEHLELILGKGVTREQIDAVLIPPGGYTIPAEGKNKAGEMWLSWPGYHGDGVNFGFNLEKDGKKVAEIERCFYRENDTDKLIAKHSALFIPNEAQGEGFGSAYYDHLLAHYRTMGVDLVELDANGTIGRYAWALQGFDFERTGDGYDDYHRKTWRANGLARLEANFGQEVADANQEALEKLQHPWEFATFTAKGPDGSPLMVKPNPTMVARGVKDEPMHLGKFMLLSGSDWGGRLDLDPESPGWRQHLRYKAAKEAAKEAPKVAEAPKPQRDYRRIVTREEHIAWNDQHRALTTAWYDDLSEKEQTAFDHYTGANYRQINSRLRGITDEEYHELNNGMDYSGWTPEYVQEVAEDLDKAIAKLEMPEDLITFRGVRSGPINDLVKQADPEKLIGMTIQDAGYCSTSLVESTSRAYIQRASLENPVIMEIRVPKGAHAAYNTFEAEVILPRDQKLRIVAVEKATERFQPHKLILEVA